MRRRDLAWIDGFYREVRAHVFIRDEDGVLILPPNQVYRLNEGGLRAIRHLAAGGRIARLPGLADGERAKQVNDFFLDLRDFYQGDSSSMDDRASVERIPYSFDYTRLPVLGEIAVTYRCNNRCRFCYASCGTPRNPASGTPHASCGTPRNPASGTPHASCGTPRNPASGTPHASCGTPRNPASGTPRGRAQRVDGPEMTLAEVERVITIFRDEARIPFFSFTGGEPLLREDLEQMVAFARRLGLEVNLVTNGTLADAARARSLRKAGLGTAQVSLEAPDADAHDALTAAVGSFQRTLAGIRALQAAGVSVQTNTTITAENAASVERMPAFLRSLGIRRFAMNLYIPDPDSPDAPALYLSYARIGAVVDAVRRAARAEGLVFYWYSPTPHCLYNPIARGLGNKSCAAVDGLLSVSPSGDVLPCSSYPLPLGNLLRVDFRSIWFSEGALHFKHKEYAPEACAGCESFVACQSACPLYWRYAGTGEIRNPARAGAAVPVAQCAGMRGGE